MWRVTKALKGMCRHVDFRGPHCLHLGVNSIRVALVKTPTQEFCTGNTNKMVLEKNIDPTRIPTDSTRAPTRAGGI